MSRGAIIAMMLVLFVLHQDFWLKDDSTLVLGILPASLAYHMGFTIVAALSWVVVVNFAWPTFREVEDDEEAKQ